MPTRRFPSSPAARRDYDQLEEQVTRNTIEQELHDLRITLESVQELRG